MHCPATAVDVTVPPADVVLLLTRTVSPDAAWIIQPPVFAVEPINATMSPTAYVVGSVSVVCPAFNARYLVNTAAVCVVPDIVAKPSPPPVADTVIDPEPLATTMPVPELIAAGVYTFPLVPIGICPADGGVAVPVPPDAGRRAFVSVNTWALLMFMARVRAPDKLDVYKFHEDETIPVLTGPTVSHCMRPASTKADPSSP